MGDLCRLHCIVPSCRRTCDPSRFPNGQAYNEWICGKHWSLVPKRLRRLYSLAKRRKKPASVLGYLWGKCREAAFAEHFMGLPS